jgi:hypothetical protein
MRIAIVAVALAMLVSTAFADTTYLIGQNGAEARGPAQSVSGNWSLGTGGVDGWVFTPPPAAGPVLFDVAADVSIWENDNWAASQFYFHFGNTGTADTLSVAIGGSMESNTPCNVQIYSPDANCNLNELTMVSTSTFEGLDHHIPLTWKYLSGANWVNCTPNGTNRVIAYPILPAGMNANLAIQVTADPDQYQADGHYHLDPILACTPALFE